MIFSIQRYVEDYLSRRGIDDLDQYAVRIANLYDTSRDEVSTDDFLSRMRKLRTVLFRNNTSLHRPEFESALLARLDQMFRRGNPHCSVQFPGGVATDARRFRAKPRTIRRLLNAFKLAVEARAIDTFWRSRRQNQLRSKPETIAQALLSVFAKGVVGSRGLVRRELASGIGFVDVEIAFGRTPHLIEVKILKGKVTGDQQLATYMRTENRQEGWLLLIDTRSVDKKSAVPDKLNVRAGTIRVLAIDINPALPSKK